MPSQNKHLSSCLRVVMAQQGYYLQDEGYKIAVAMAMGYGRDYAAACKEDQQGFLLTKRKVRSAPVWETVSVWRRQTNACHRHGSCLQGAYSHKYLGMLHQAAAADLIPRFCSIKHPADSLLCRSAQNCAQRSGADWGTRQRCAMPSVTPTTWVMTTSTTMRMRRSWVSPLSCPETFDERS